MAAKAAPMMPLYGFLEGDTIGLLVLAREEMSIADLAARLQRSARVRVGPKPALNVIHQGRLLDPRSTVQQSGIKPLDRVDVVESPQ